MAEPGSTTPPDKRAQVSASGSAPGCKYTLVAPLSAFTVPMKAARSAPTLRFLHVTLPVNGKVADAR